MTSHDDHFSDPCFSGPCNSGFPVLWPLHPETLILNRMSAIMAHMHSVSSLGAPPPVAPRALPVRSWLPILCGRSEQDPTAMRDVRVLPQIREAGIT